jgi:hypothetical protein
MQSQTKEIQDITEKREKNSELTVQHVQLMRAATVPKHFSNQCPQMQQITDIICMVHGMCECGYK